jgi:hypothetical protein
LAFVTKSPEFANKWIGKGKMQKRVGDQAKQELKSAEDMYRDMKSEHMDYDNLSKLEGDEFHSEYDRRNAIFKAEAEREFGLQGSPDKIHSTVYPLTVESNKIFNPETDMDVMADFFKANDIPKDLQDLYAGGNYMMYETKPVVEYLKGKGYDSMRLRESTGDDYPTIAVFNPESIRSKFAAHDPFRRDAATAAAMGVLAPDLMAEEKKKAKGGEVHMDGGGAAFYPRVGNIKSKNFKPIKPPPLVEDPRAMNLPQYGDIDLSVPTKENLEMGRRMAQRDADLKRQREGDRSLPEKIAGGAQAGRFIGSALTQAVNSLPTRMAYGDEAADKFMQERLYKPEQPTAYEYVDDVGNFLERLETEYKIPPILPEATALQYLAGPAASQAKKAAGQGALSLAKSDAAYNLAQKALASPALAAVRPMNVVKPKDGNFLTGRTEKDLKPLRQTTASGSDATEILRQMREKYTPEAIASLPEHMRARIVGNIVDLEKDAALNKWVDSNLTNYVKKQMGTPDDPVRKLAEQGITHKAAILENGDLHPAVAEELKNQRKAAGFPEEGMGQSPLAKAWELASDNAIATHRAGDIQGMPEQYAKFQEAERKIRAARQAVVRKFEQQMENVGITDPNNMHYAASIDEKAKMVGDTDLAKANAEYKSLQSPMMDSYIKLGKENPWISKVNPETPVYTPFTGDLGFDHIMDVLREDVTAGRIRPDQLNKVSMEQAVRRTYEYDQEMAAKANASRAAAREGLPTYKEYPEGYKWIELNQPGSFAQESEAMGHSVRGYEPPKGHPDWTEASGDAGSSGYGHGGWEAIKSGKAKVYSLVDPKGAPHATVEVRAKNDPGWSDVKIMGGDPLAIMQEAKLRMGLDSPEAEKALIKNADGDKRREINQLLEKHFSDVFREQFGEPPSSITQIKGKSNRAPNEEYLPYVQDFVKSGKWSDVGDIQNTGMRPKSSVFGDAELQMLRERGEVDIPHILSGEEIQRLHNIIVPEGKRLKYDAKGNIVGSEEGLAHGGAVHMAGGGLLKSGVKKLLGMADEVPKGVEPIVVKPKVDHPLVFPRAAAKTKEDIRPIAQRMAEQVTGDFVRQNPKLTTNPAGKSRKQYNREQEIPLETRRLTEEKPVPFVDYASKKGNILLGVPGDPTLGGVAKRGSLEESARPTVELTRVGDITPDSPVPLFGGPRYGDEEKFWASNYGAAAPIQNNANELSKLYEAPVLGQYIKMAPGSENFAVHNLDSLLAIQQPEKLNKTKLSQLNTLVKRGSDKYGSFPGFAGFEDPIDVLLQAQLNPKLRKHIAEILTKPTITDSLGLPSGLDVVAAITHPQLRNLETGASGFSIGEMRPGSNLRQFRGAHPTYDTDIPGAAIGQSRYPIPLELAFPDTTAYARSQMKPGVQEFNMIKLLGPRERIDQQYIDEMKMYEELMKQYTGQKKGGAVTKPKKPSRAIATTD